MNLQSESTLPVVITEKIAVRLATIALFNFFDRKEMAHLDA